MKSREQRIAPLPESQWDDETRKTLESLRRDGQIYNIFSTLANHPDLMKRWMVFANHVLAKSTLPARDREILILRAGWLCEADYEWRHHKAIAGNVGVTPEEIIRIEQGPDALGWDAFDRTLVRAVDELHTGNCVSTETWNELAERYNTQQLMDLVFAVGQYHLVSMVLNSLGIQVEPGF